MKLQKQSRDQDRLVFSVSPRATHYVKRGKDNLPREVITHDLGMVQSQQMVSALNGLQKGYNFPVSQLLKNSQATGQHSPRTLTSHKS
mmetsp:Transcript_43705/g.57906  ORF Transcript_43705/g.57906 Transcript_43705/m.57906 type:complete len:88 (+) Transcript_43705:1609-1872(+)